jgi:hypothetical protein
VPGSSGEPGPRAGRFLGRLVGQKAAEANEACAQAMPQRVRLPHGGGEPGMLGLTQQVLPVQLSDGADQIVVHDFALRHWLKGFGGVEKNCSTLEGTGQIVLLVS